MYTYDNERSLLTNRERLNDGKYSGKVNLVQI